MKSFIILSLTIFAISAVSASNSPRQLDIWADIKGKLPQLKSKVQARSLEFGQCVAKGGLEAAKAAAPAILAAVVAKFTGRRLGLFNKFTSAVKNAGSAVASGAAAAGKAVASGAAAAGKAIASGASAAVSAAKPLACGAIKSQGVSQCVSLLKGVLSQAKDEVLKKCPSAGPKFESVMLPCLEAEVQVACQAVANEICPSRRILRGHGGSHRRGHRGGHRKGHRGGHRGGRRP
jgi:hypothetical protein